MNRIAELLLYNVNGTVYPEQTDVYFDKLIQCSKQFPRVHIKIESDFEKIKLQYVDICKAIVEKCPEDLLVTTLFAANEQLMSAYNKLDSDIPRMQALWFSDVLDYLEKDTKYKLNIGRVMYFIFISTFMMYMFK